MKRRGLIVVLVSFLFLFPSFAQSQPDRILEKLFGPKLHPNDLRVLQLEMNPDPVREGQWVSFQAAVSNRSRDSARVTLFVKDKDEVITAVYDVLLKPGNNRIFFPYARYQFQRFDHCFIVIVDVERTPYQVDAKREFCARPYGWTLRP